jgi:TRAP-type C4-dicarboxylate transport system permease small subunit
MGNFAKVALPPILKILEAICSVLIFTMMILTFADVIGRYVFISPIFGAAEMIQFLLAMTIFAGLSLVNAHDDHITVDLFEPFLDQFMPNVRRFLVQTFSVVVMAIITVEMTRFALEAHQLSSITVVLEWPLVIVSGAVAALSAVSLIVQILGLISPERTSKPDNGGDEF